MRIDSKDLVSITQAFQECFVQGDHLWLFGSRVDDKKRGGDIDLYIEVQDYNFKKVFDAQRQFWILLQDRLGEQKIDIVVRDPEQDLLIYQVARADGILLI